MPSSTETAAYGLARQGIAVVLLRAGSKRPISDQWTDLPRMTEADLRRRMQADMNIGIRLGAPSELGRRRWVYGVDLDIREPRAADEAWDALLRIFPGAENWPRVVSGSGGESRHLYLLSDAIFRKCNLARSKHKVEVQTLDGMKEKPEWEVDFYGTGAQMVLPPSIHPNTKRAYRWEDGDEPQRWIDDLPFVRQTQIAPFFERHARKRRVDHPVEPIDNLLDILDTQVFENDGAGLPYDDWRDVVFAVKQEYDGTDFYDEAFQALEEWSQRSDKHDQRRFEEVWDHARTDRAAAITLGTLKKKANPELVERRHERIVGDMTDERDDDEKAGAPKPDAWKRGLKHDDDGLTNCAENRLLILNNEPAFEHLTWAEEEQQAVWRRPEEGALHPDLKHLTFGGNGFLPYDKGSHYQILQICFSRAPYMMTTVRKEELNDSVVLAAQKRPWYRIREMLTTVKWDGRRRVETLLQDYLGVKDGPYARDVSKLLVLGPMCRVLWRAVKVDYAPILQGPQGTGKDRFLELLCTFDNDECLYTASTIDLSKPSEYVQAIRGKLIVHLSEMAAFRRTSNEQMKQFLTEHEDTARLSYEAVARTYRRLCLFVFSVNERGGYLTDATGNRRYLPVELGDPRPGADGRPTAYKKNFYELELDRAQIWAEAFEMATAEAKRQGGRVRELLLSPEGLSTARRVQAAKMAELPEDDLAARGARLLDEPVPLDDLLPPGERTPETARKMAIRNQVGIREFWVDVLGERRETWARNTHLTSRALDTIPGWVRIDGKQRHLGETRTVYRRASSATGTPTICDDVTAPERGKVIKMDDERKKRRSRDD